MAGDGGLRAGFLAATQPDAGDVRDGIQQRGVTADRLRAKVQRWLTKSITR